MKKKKEEEKKGLIFSSETLKYLSVVIQEEDVFIKQNYNYCVNFFEQVLKQELNADDKKVIEKYYSNFKTKHYSRLKFWNTMGEPYIRGGESNGRASRIHDYP